MKGWYRIHTLSHIHKPLNIVINWNIHRCYRQKQSLSMHHVLAIIYIEKYKSNMCLFFAAFVELLIVYCTNKCDRCSTYVSIDWRQLQSMSILLFAVATIFNAPHLQQMQLVISLARWFYCNFITVKCRCNAHIGI